MKTYFVSVPKGKQNDVALSCYSIMQALLSHSLCLLLSLSLSLSMYLCADMPFLVYLNCGGKQEKKRHFIKTVEQEVLVHDRPGRTHPSTHTHKQAHTHRDVNVIRLQRARLLCYGWLATTKWMIGRSIWQNWVKKYSPSAFFAVWSLRCEHKKERVKLSCWQAPDLLICFS